MRRRSRSTVLRYAAEVLQHCSGPVTRAVVSDDGAVAARTFRSAAAKSLYVSPFMPVDLDYAFAFTTPASRLVAHMQTSRAGAVGFDATLSLERRAWNAAELRRALTRYPAMTTNVIAQIHWQALKLWWKGVPVVPRVPGVSRVE